LETDTIIIVVSAVVSVVVVPVSTLLGVKITQRNHRETKRMKLAANRDLKTMELGEQREGMKRQERREVYLDLLSAYRMSVQYAAQMGHMALGQQFQVDIRTVEETQERFKRLIPELEIVGSDEVKDLLQELYRATARCNDVMYTESEKRFTPFDQRGQQPTPQQTAAIWKEVSAEVQQVYEEMSMEGLYAQLRTQIRKELGFTSQDTDPTLSPEEAKKLHSQLLNMDQMRLRSTQQNTGEKG
jgi:hypothetical protein